jgi:hypothetical protein
MSVAVLSDWCTKQTQSFSTDFLEWVSVVDLMAFGPAIASLSAEGFQLRTPHEQYAEFVGRRGRDQQANPSLPELQLLCDSCNLVRTRE